MRKILNSITTRIILIIIVLVLPINLLGIIASNKVMDSLIEQTKLSIGHVSDVYITLLKERMYNTDFLLHYIRTKDSNGVEFFKQVGDFQYTHAKYKLASKINEHLILYNGADCYYFYMKKTDDMLVCTKRGDYENTLKLKKYLNDTSHFEKNQKWYLIDLDGVLWLFRSICITDDAYYGAAINLSNIIRDIRKDLNYKQFHISFDTNLNKIDKNNNVYISSNVEGSNVCLNIYVSKYEILKNISLSARGLTILALIFLLCVPLLFVFLHSHFIKPLGKLNYAHNQIKLGNQHYRITEPANTIEMQETFDSFNTMADNIVNLKIENLEKELAKQRIELRNLQLQIRPHFLLNTFNLICILVKKKRTEEVLDLVMYLSDYFRYLFRSENDMELFSKELQLIKQYLRVAAIRYPRRFEVIYDIEPETEFVPVPPMLIHTFVENIIRHALKEDELTHITITSQYEYENKMVVFRIIDDGKGMTEEEIEKIKKLYFSANYTGQKHVGLHNTYMRVKHFYGEQANIEVISKRGVGTCFTIYIPYNLEDDYEIVDS